MKIKNCAREMFWPEMNSDIKYIVRTCNICQQNHKRQRRETYIKFRHSDIPWIKVGTDLFEIYSKSYLLVVDYISNPFDISGISDKCSFTAVIHMK